MIGKWCSRGNGKMSENNINIEFSSNLDEYIKLVERLYKETLALKETSEAVDGFEVRFELKEHEQLPEYDQDEAVEFIKQDCRTSILSESAIRKVLDVEEDYMRSKGIIED